MAKLWCNNILLKTLIKGAGLSPPTVLLSLATISGCEAVFNSSISLLIWVRLHTMECW